jgi:acyl-CoA synthetase (AMP-forming)/AMP-acid ligase II
MGNERHAASRYTQRWQQRCREIESAALPADFREVISRAAERYGDRPALCFIDDDVVLSYEALQLEVMRLASAFHDRGIGKGTHVAVQLPNRIEFPLSWLALACLGAVMVPVNVAYTASELDYLCNDADVSYLITDRHLLAAFLGMERRPAAIKDDHVFVIGGDDRRFAAFETIRAAGNPAFEFPGVIDSSDLLNIQYTSGTTGFPKGCMQTQRYWIVLGTTAGEISPAVRSLLTDHPYFYMDPQWELVWGLLSGVTVYAVGKMSTTRFWERVRAHNVEWAWFPNPILKHPAAADDADNPIRMFAAGAISAAAIHEAEARFGAPVRSAYGMTEIGAGTWVPVDVLDDEILETVGLPAPFRELRIVDQDGNDVADGEPGELIVRGDGLFLGYYKKPEANDESFYGDWFRTGDMFVRTVNGYYKIIGRYKDMIRRSAENISAMEVEHTVREISEVAEAAAVPVPDDYRGEEVKVYVRLKDGLDVSDCSPQQILAHCRQHLAPFKVPRYVAYLADVPYTPSNKVAKHEIIAGCDDLRKGAWDDLDQTWR